MLSIVTEVEFFQTSVQYSNYFQKLQLTRLKVMRPTKIVMEITMDHFKKIQSVVLTFDFIFIMLKNLSIFNFVVSREFSPFCYIV